MREIKDVEMLLEESEDEIRAPLIFQSVVELILGIFLVLFRDKTSNILFIVIGVLMVGYGVFDLIAFALNKKPYSFRQGLASGVLTAVVGIAFIIQADKLADLLIIVLGALIIIECIINCKRALIIRDMGFKFWNISLIISCIVLVMGVLVCIFPDIFQEIISVILGFVIIVVGLVDLWSMLTLIRLRQKFKTDTPK